MTDPLTDTELHDLLDRATDAIESPSLAAPALHLARRRRTRRRGAAAAVVVSGVVTAVLVATHLGGNTGVAPPTAPTKTPSDERTDGPVVQPQWDPREAVDLPAAPDEIAAALPESIDPPDTSPALADQPVPAAVLVVAAEDAAQVLSTDGAWRSVPLLNESSVVKLSPGGTRLSVWQSSGRRPATVYDVATGDSRDVPLPPSYAPSNATWLTFADDDTLLLGTDGGRGWAIDATTGIAEDFPHSVDGFAGFDPSGAFLTAYPLAGPKVLTDYADGTARGVSMARTGRLTSLQATAGTVVGTSEEFQDKPLAVVVADRRSLTPLVSLPLLDSGGLFGFGRLRVMAVSDVGTVLLEVPSYPEANGFRVVAWDPETGDLSLVTSYIGAEYVVFADALIRQGAGTEPTEPAIDPALVQAPFTSSADLPQERSLSIPADLTAPSDPNGSGGVVGAVQTPDGDVTLVRAGGAETADYLPEGTLFRHSLAGDGGAVALRTEAGFTVYSMFDERASDYDVARTGDSGLWLSDSVGFVYDIPGPGGVSREHEPPYSEDTMGFPAGDDLDEMDEHSSGGAYEMVDGFLVRWADFQGEAGRVDLRSLGDLRGLVAGEERLAVVRSGGDRDGVLVLDHDGGPQALLPVDGVDVDDVVLHHWVDGSRLLVQAGDRLVLWDVDGQRLTQVSALPAGAVLSIGDGDGSLVRR